ncbi:Cys-tRNA(Pro) deacylase [uncultured Methanosphaera sp.]|uniref:Cys-tRNA(Pro) deacylase n=1 Tax=uncultured Methanosphaera sp. TaxID=262501 RepID=UPI0025D3B4DC|nr:Cys-tRNA(Pro) deacylase [uncultured Methanosphaera sp.]
MKHHEDKTNVMRLLEQRNIPYKSHYYKDSGLISGVDVINYLHENPDSAYKTLVTRSKTDENYVFLVPVSKELDLKLAAEAVDEKKIKMVKSKELLSLTGYTHGGCSPIGMKHTYPTIIDDSAKQFETIYFSGGKIGYQVELRLDDLRKIINFKLKHITK